LRGYRSDWAEFTAWCARLGREPLLAAADTISAYLTELARAGAKVGTMSRRLSAIRFAHQLRDLPDPTTGARVVAVWEGIRRTHGAPPEQAAPLTPPQLFDMLDACPTTKVWKTRGRPAEPDLAGLRDRALLLVGFWGALRRSELAGLTLDQITDHDRGLVLEFPHSKTNQHGTENEHVVLPRASHPARCPVTALRAWLDAARIDLGHVPGQQGQPPPLPSPAPGVGQQPGAGRGRPRRPGPSPVQRPLPARRVRHLRPPARGLRLGRGRAGGPGL
jgi:integrase